jgi:NAD(P)-dependent dehydrogenase (short-subunit alcohol dehydrogenase family)
LIPLARLREGWRERGRFGKRSQESLEQLSGESPQAGGKALPVTADTSDAAQVQGVAEAAEREFGRLDTWVQAAAVSVYAPMDVTRPEAFRRVIDVNLTG